MVSFQQLIARGFLIFNLSLTTTQRRVPLMVFSVEMGKNYFKEFLDRL